MAASNAKAIDLHAHILADETVRLLTKEAPLLGIKLSALDDEFGVLEVAGVPYRPFPRGGWDLERRLADMDFAGIGAQVLSNAPQTFLYGIDASLAAVVAAVQNDQIAKTVTAYPDRFYGIATLPMQTPERAAAELDRAMVKLGLKGAQIGSNVNGRNLDDPALEPVWAAADRLGALIMVHPTQIAGADRLKSYYLANLVGNPLDTTIAVAALVFGGVVSRFPNIKFFFVHGGGFAPWQAGRFAHGWTVRSEPKARLAASPQAALATLFYDSILHAQPQLECLVKLVGASHIALGSDYPYDMGTLECVRQVTTLPIADADKAQILSGVPLALIGEG
jgi:aminocarboxymuconate-semialdehyde decarboxylase